MFAFQSEVAQETHILEILPGGWGSRGRLSALAF